MVYIALKANHNFPIRMNKENIELHSAPAVAVSVCLPVEIPFLIETLKKVVKDCCEIWQTCSWCPEDEPTLL